ncbi:heterokaryon incompatibility protein-domain-containing protein [Dactylonectria macrodidyma]|uniref:Heterokaryon incompatibility protein-domain-containing protein n=1 Tax=Dactylonectria macrodidyma TaxID=307937 RepID=A0A9P9EQE9_9HYPO|nr:heterokaryon incompatibility protein-domain-containing protein [Dactylonectria macrodidyma]
MLSRITALVPSMGPSKSPQAAPSAQNLCIQCKILPAAWLVPRFYDLRDSKYPEHKEPYQYPTYSTWAELQASASACALCALVVHEAQSTSRRPYTKPSQPGVLFQAFGSSRLEVWCVETEKCAQLNVALDGADIHRIPAHAKGLFDSHIVSSHAGDERNVATIRHWLSVCTSSHTNCPNWASSRRIGRRHLPTRVLDVGGVGDESISLHLASDSDTSDYIALSYCWGPRKNPIVTTTESLSRHVNTGIKVSDLPETLRHAVHLTRLLNVKYLWIDALCIIQHDRDDWIREAAQMSSVYSQALLTIAADGATDTYAGLFRERSERHGTSVELPWPLEEPGDGAGPLRLHVTPTFRSFKDEMESTPLSKRGWTFQERALSARIVHFTPEMCYWECKDACIGEDEEIGKYSVQDGFFHLKDLLLPPDGERALTKARMHDKWAWVVEKYTNRQLTNAGDLFAALEGIAMVFAEKDMLGKYCCGLWEDELLRHLLWYSSRPEDGSWGLPHRRPEQYRAPTWSWASIHGPVENPAIQIYFEYSSAGIQMTQQLGKDGLLTHSILDVEAVSVEVEGSSGFGPVRSASLKAKGILCPILLGRQIKRREYELLAEGGDVVGSARWDVDDEPPVDLKLWICPVMQRQKLTAGWAKRQSGHAKYCAS